MHTAPPTPTYCIYKLVISISPSHFSSFRNVCARDPVSIHNV